MTTDQLLSRAAVLLSIREAGHINNRTLTPAGFDWIDGELMTIDNELDQLKPEGQFITVYNEENEVAGFECFVLVT